MYFPAIPYLCGMKKLIFLAILIGILLSSCGEPKPKVLRLAVASNLQYVINPLVDAFKKTNPGETEIILGSSGKLSTQIINSAPFDVFISADQKYPLELHKKNLTLTAPETYAQGELVLWSLATDEKLDLNILDLSKIEHFAIPNPEIAPYGKVAVEALKFYGWYDQLEKKLVMGENISQTNQFIISKNAQLGMTALSSVVIEPMKKQGVWTTLNPDSFTPIRQDVVVLNKSKERGTETDATAFVKFLKTEEAQNILQKHGYKIIQTK